MIILKASERYATARVVGRITTGSVGIPVELELSDDFDGLAVTVCFECGGDAADVVWYDGAEVTVPAQLLEHEGTKLNLGVYGANTSGEIVIPTIWATAGFVNRGVVPSGVDPSESEPDWTAQVQAIAAEAIQTANSVRADADAGEFDGPPGPQGDPAPVDMVQDAVSDWLDEHPEATTTVQNDSVTGPKIIADGMIAELTRNLYDGYTKIDGANINSTKINSSAVGTVAFCPVTGGETYTVSKGNSSRFRLGFTETLPAVNVPIFGYYTNDAISEKTLVAPEGAAYLCVFFHNSSEDTATEAEVRATIQVEQGSTATEYIPRKTLIDFVARSGIEAAVTDFEEAMTDTFRRMGSLVSALPGWDGDWDNVRQMGIYAVTSTVSHVNAPTNDSGTLIVLNGSTTATANNRILQYFVVGTGTNRTFMRFWGGSVWQRWKEVTGGDIMQPTATPPADTAGVYALFDTLVTAGVATKSLKGTTSAGEQLYEYVVKPSPSWGATGLVVYSDDESLYPRLKVGVMSCVHGDERGTVSYAYTLASMLAHADPRVAEIGALCEWHFLPVANPYGFDNDTRENRNGIDLNDDAENLTQDESHIIKAWMDSVSWDMFADLHQTTYGKSSGSTEAARNHCGGLVLPKPVSDAHKKRLAYAFRAISRKLASAYAYDGQHEVVWSGNTKKSWRWYAENTLHVLVWNTEISRTCYAISGSNTEQNSNALAYGCTFVYLMTCEIIKQLAAATLAE